MIIRLLNDELFKERLKKLVPPSLWERARKIPQKNFLFGLIFTLFIRKYRTNGLVFEVPYKLFPLKGRSSLLFDCYERAERSECERHIRSDDKVIEFGGGIGVISCTINRKLKNPEAHVVVEANPEALVFLHRNKKRNKARFLALHGVVSPNKIESMYFGEALSEFSRESYQTRIAGTTLTDLHQKYGPFNVLVMDIEGAELFVASESAHLLKEYRLIILELHPSIIGEADCEAVRSIFRSSGFVRKGDISCVETWERIPN